MQRSIKHEQDCQCKHPLSWTGTESYTAELCDNCPCLEYFGTCSWRETWGDHYAGGINECREDALPGVDRCALHGGLAASENARLRRRLQLAAKRYDVLKQYLDDFLAQLALNRITIATLQTKLEAVLATGVATEPTRIHDVGVKNG